MALLQMMLFFFLFLLLTPTFSVLQAEPGIGPASLDALVAQAEANNPEVMASEERWQMVVARARQAGALEDPMLMLRIQNGLIRAPLDFQQDPMTAKVIGLSQKLPFYGKRDLMRAEAGFEAEAERWSVAERRLELRRMVKEAWYQIGLVDRSQEAVAGNIRVLDDLVELAQSLYGVGKSGQQEVFQAQLERSKMEELSIALGQKRRSLVAGLNALVFRPVETAVPVIAPPPLPGFTLTAAELEGLAQAHRPALKGAQARIDQAGAGSSLAEKEKYPDVTLSLEYMQREPAMESAGDDMYGAQLTFNLPVQTDRRQARVAEAQAQRRLAVQELAALRNRIRLAISDGLAQLDRSRQLARLYDQGILVQAAGSLESALAAYRNNRARFAEVLAACMARFNSERDYHGALADFHLQLAGLEGVVGTGLPPSP